MFPVENHSNAPDKDNNRGPVLSYTFLHNIVCTVNRDFFSGHYISSMVRVDLKVVCTLLCTGEKEPMYQMASQSQTRPNEKQAQKKKM